MKPSELLARLREGGSTIVAHHKGRRRIVSAIIAWTHHREPNARRYMLLWEVSREPTKLVTPKHKAWLMDAWLPSGRSYRLERVGLTRVQDAPLVAFTFAMGCCGRRPPAVPGALARGLVGDA